MDSMHDMGYLRIATTILAAVLTLQPSQISLDENVNQDVLICGVLDGWEHLQNQDWICPLWRIIQQIDLSITINSGIVTRLCMLRGMHLYLLVRFFLPWILDFTDFPSLLFRPKRFSTCQCGIYLGMLFVEIRLGLCRIVPLKLTIFEGHLSFHLHTTS